MSSITLLGFMGMIQHLLNAACRCRPGLAVSISFLSRAGNSSENAHLLGIFLLKRNVYGIFWYQYLP
jgi:hypothetical protein